MKTMIYGMEAPLKRFSNSRKNCSSEYRKENMKTEGKKDRINKGRPKHNTPPMMGELMILTTAKESR